MTTHAKGYYMKKNHELKFLFYKKGPLKQNRLCQLKSTITYEIAHI